MRRFLRLFVSVPANIEIAFACGIRFAAVDAAFFKHNEFRDGCLHLLTTRDGNNEVLVLAWAICETESGDTYEFFATWCHEAGLSRYLNKSCVIFSDRQKGINKFHDRFRAHFGKCFRHLIENAKAHIKGTGESFADETAWCLRKAFTKKSYFFWLAKIKATSPKAAHYFNVLSGPHEHLYEYMMIFLRIACHGHKTSNIVECGNGVFVDARWLAPYRFNDKVLGWCGEKLKERVDKIIKWIEKGHILTPYCHELFQQQVLKSLCPLLCLIKSAQTCAHCAQVELAKRSGYAVVSGDGAGKLFYVQNMQKADGEQIEVDMRDGMKSVDCCAYVHMHRQPCRHMVPIFWKFNMMNGARGVAQCVNNFWPKWAKAVTLLQAYQSKSVARPKIYAGKFVGDAADRIAPPKQGVKKRGRPKKKRYRYKKQTVQSIIDKLPTVYNERYGAVLQFF